MARPDCARAAPGNADGLAGGAGDWPFLPPGLRGRPMVSVGYVWTGDPDDGRALLPALRGGTPPVAEQTQALTYLQLQSIDDQSQAPGQRRYWKGHYLREFGDDAIGAFVSCGARDGDGQSTRRSWHPATCRPTAARSPP